MTPSRVERLSPIDRIVVDRYDVRLDRPGLRR
jgi:hypothetical protein